MSTDSPDDRFLVVTAGEVIARRGSFKSALREAKRYVKENGSYATIEVEERRLITGVYANGHIIGRAE